MGRSTVHYADSETNNILKRLHNKLRPAGTPVERVEYIIELLLLRIFEAKIKHDETFTPLRKLFEGENYRLLFSHLFSLNGEQILSGLNKNIFPFYSTILSKAQKVVRGNLPQKMQDQLVLMEEVFANSNFTNNVKGGVIAEVIGMVNEIDEQYILKTDLLGDAIESALSETGGTKDLGLYRTPDHIRRMMVEMVDPDFTDTIFDPACGTAGFLFDAYDYVIEKAQKTRKMPSENTANMFYRTGIGGIEYQGRIRKMAAVNMYIRGLNPHNIEQGDSLKLYEPSRDGGSKSVVIANPPFGAERDQPAYPNVWEEYSRESETTILFVKLMFDLLKKNGRCAVVVSEGFLTWGQNSASALRKLLLNETNLRAVISLPQGVFVSKSGQGAKTSILYFEKGQTTDFIWYYKIENDGFSTGTNRKAIAGSQIPELLELFKVVKQSGRPSDTKHSFCVSKEQIETLDPRLADRLKIEISEKTKEKNAKKREKLIISLDKKFAGKKISKEIYNEKLWQFDNIVEGQIDNGVAKAIEKAHSYHFNLQNYRSNLSDQQQTNWKRICEGGEVLKGKSSGKVFQALLKTDPKQALNCLCSFDPQNALQIEIASAFLNELEDEVLKSFPKLGMLFEIIKETRQFSFEKLKQLLRLKLNKITLDKMTLYKQVTVKLYGKGIELRQEVLGSEIQAEQQNIVSAGDFIISKIDARTGAFGIVPVELEGAVVSQDFPSFEINSSIILPQYLALVVQTPLFYEKINDLVAGATGRRRVEIDNFLDLSIPLPSLEVQDEIVQRISSQKCMIESVEKIEESYEPDGDQYFGKFEELKLGSVIKETSEKNKKGEQLTVFLVSKNKGMMPSEEYFSDRTISKISSDDLSGYKIIRKNQFAYSGIHANEGAIGYLKDHEIGLLSPIYRVFSLDVNRVLTEYLNVILKSRTALKYYNQNTSGAIERRTNLDFEYFSEFKIPLPPLETQRQIVDRLHKQKEAIQGMLLLKSEAQKLVQEILAEVWGQKSESIGI